VVGLGAIHFVIDALKIAYNIKSEVRYFVLDQSLHFLSVLVATYLASQFWTTMPVGILPDTLLYLSFTCAFTLAIIVLCWVWTNGLSEEQVRRYMLLHWVKYRALAFEQRIGFALFALICFGQFIIK
jgi:hypothetical protein